MTPAEVHALAIAAGLGHDAAVIATAIAWAESGLRSDAVGDVDLADDTWGPSVGLYQVRSLRSHTGTCKERDVERLGDPTFNTRAMVAISSNGTNWQPWSVWKNGKYLSHLDAVRSALDDTPVNGWMPDVLHTPPNSRAGLDWVGGTAWKLLLHTTESNYRRSQGGRTNYHGHQSYPHFEVSEEAIEQYLPITVGAYALAGSTSQYGYGNAAHAVQIEIVWAAANARNMSEGLLRNIASVLTFLRTETGMTPNLPPQGFPERISQDYWFSKQGWYDFEGLAGHGNVPGNFDRWDPGPLPAERIVAFSDEEMSTTPGPTPEPEPDTEESNLFIFDYKVGEDHRGILYSDGFFCWGVTGETLAFYNTGKVPHLGAKGPEFLAELTFRDKQKSPRTVAQTEASSTDLVDVDGCATLFGPVEALAGTG